MSVLNLRDSGGRMPPGAVRIDRRTRWGNPCRIGRTDRLDAKGRGITTWLREQTVEVYRLWIGARLDEDPDFLEPLRGKTLACWCAPEPCHGDVIAELLSRSELAEVAP